MSQRVFVGVCVCMCVSMISYEYCERRRQSNSRTLHSIWRVYAWNAYVVWLVRHILFFILSQHIWIYKHGLISWAWDCFSQCVVVFPSSSFFLFDLTWLELTCRRIESHRIASNGMSEHWRWPWASFECARIMHPTHQYRWHSGDENDNAKAIAV